MAGIDNGDIIEKLELLQKTVWSIDEKTRRNLESIAKQQLNIAQVKKTLESVYEKLAKLETEIRDLSKAEEV